MPSKVFFSVLVLHWITSKDNASTHHSSQNAEIHPGNTPPSPKCLVPRPPISDPGAYEIGLREYSKKGRVTTLVTASRDRDDDYNLEKINSLPPNCVTVETEHIRKVEELVIEEADLGEKTMGREIGSTEELCRRQ